MNLDKFTLKAQEAITNSISIAKEYQHQAILPEHLLFALIDDPRGIARQILIKLAVNLDDLTSKLKNNLSSMPKVYGEEKEIYASPRLNEILNSAQKYRSDFDFILDKARRESLEDFFNKLKYPVVCEHENGQSLIVLSSSNLRLEGQEEENLRRLFYRELFR